VCTGILSAAWFATWSKGKADKINLRQTYRPVTRIDNSFPQHSRQLYSQRHMSPWIGENILVLALLCLPLPATVHKCNWHFPRRVVTPVFTNVPIANWSLWPKGTGKNVVRVKRNIAFIKALFLPQRKLKTLYNSLLPQQVMSFLIPSQPRGRHTSGAHVKRSTPTLWQYLSLPFVPGTPFTHGWGEKNDGKVLFPRAHKLAAASRDRSRDTRLLPGVWNRAHYQLS